MSKDALINKFRPTSFAEVLGNELVIASLQAAINSQSRPHAYLLTGVAGIGKTSIARIIASVVGASIEEIDAATNSGVDNARLLVENAQFQPLTQSGSKMFIIDECHALSSSSWKALLKLVEEPPPYLYIALATTELSKVPDAIRTRCFSVSLKPCKAQEIEDLLVTVAEIEGWSLNNDVLSSIVLASTGQPRKALSLLQSGHVATSREQLALIVAEVEQESTAVLELCRYLVKGGKDWKMIASILTKIEDNEDVLAQAHRWLLTAMVNAENEAIAKNIWKILDALSFPRVGYDKRVQLATAVGAYLGW